MLLSEGLAVCRRFGVHVVSMKASDFTLVYFTIGERHHHDRSPQDHGDDPKDLLRPTPRRSTISQHQEAN
jgi:hypothetical protein